MLEFAMNCWVTVVACAGCSCVSPWTSLIFVLLARLSVASGAAAATATATGHGQRTDRCHGQNQASLHGYASIPGLSHDEEVGIIAAPSGADWPNAPRIGRLRDLAPERRDRADSIRPPQWPKFVKLIKPSQFGRWQED
jgi:hypothetical protein